MPLVAFSMPGGTLETCPFGAIKACRAPIEVWVLPKNQFFHHNLLADQFVQRRGRYQRRISRSEPSISFFRILTGLPARQVADSANDQDRNTIDISDLRYHGAFHFVKTDFP